MSDRMNSRAVREILAEHAAYLQRGEGNAGDLSGRTLVGSLAGRDLRRVLFRDCSLSNLDFLAADLSGAILDNANARKAILCDADLRGASLISADFKQADLARCNMEGADVQGADFRDANVNVDQVLSSKNWLLAYWSQETLKALALPEDHNTRVISKNFESYTLTRRNLAGSNLRDARLCEVDLEAARLDRADFAGSDLTRSQLRRASLVGAIVTAGQLRSARSWFLATYGDGELRKNLNLPDDHNERVERMDFSGLDLRHRDLSLHDFTGWTLVNTDLEQAILRDSDLQGSIGLTANQLRGADLTNAVLPKGMVDFAVLKSMDDSSTNASTLLITMLGACLFCCLTVAATSDAALFVGDALTPLPLVQIPISVVTFYWVAPILLFIMYLYFHFSLQLQWEAMASLPAIFPDGRPVYQRVYPWLVNGTVRSHFALLSSPLSARFQNIISNALAWWAVPATIVYFWWRFLVTQYWPVTQIQVAIGLLAVFSAWSFQRAKRATLVGPVASLPGLWRTILVIMCYAVFLFLAFTVVMALSDIAAHETHADLKGIELSRRSGVVGQNSVEDLKTVRGVRLLSKHLADARAEYAFAPKATSKMLICVERFCSMPICDNQILRAQDAVVTTILPLGGLESLEHFSSTPTFEVLTLLTLTCGMKQY